MVVEGEAVIRFRRIDSDEVIEHRVSGLEFKVVDIPPGYTHHITNTGQGELVTLFWASEMFNPEQPDTFFLKVFENSEF
jgi:UDP-2-acetamido-2,6-beta-L-arabino-hexul-4-ose reductase